MKKDKEIREGLNRLLSEPTDPTRGERFLNKLTGQGSIPERLSSLREKLGGLMVEAEDLSSLLGYHSGSRLSQVIDHLKQAETLTEETMTLTTGQASSEKYEILDMGDNWEIWDHSLGIGIRFEKGDRLSRYRLTDIVEDRSILTTDEGMNLLNETRRRLLSFAEERFPQEFGTEVR